MSNVLARKIDEEAPELGVEASSGNSELRTRTWMALNAAAAFTHSVCAMGSGTVSLEQQWRHRVAKQ